MPSKNSSTPKKTTKTAFVLSLPTTMPAAEVVQKAKADGIKLDVKYVYNIRATARTAAKKGGTKKLIPKKKIVRAPSTSAKNASGSSEATFRRLVIDLGLARAKSLLGDVERKLGELIAGR